jgi:hypothetical protein
MKKKKRDPEEVLDRAEKLFERGNYLLAKQGLEKINRILKDEDIAEKIQICEQEIAQQKSKELIKKGRKSLKKGDIGETLKCFEEAYALCAEDWLPERIEELKAELSGRNSVQAAKDAEKSGDYEKAAELYEQAFENQESEDILLKKARSLVKAEKYEEAVAVYKELSLSDDGARYDFGFALARLHRYHECLKVWDTVNFPGTALSEQKLYVQSLLTEDMFKRFIRLTSETSDPAAQSPDFSRLYKEGIYLLENRTPETESRQNSTLLHLVEYCRYARIDQLWRQEEYEKIAELLHPYPPEMDLDRLQLYAKTFFRAAEMSGKYLSDMTMFWLTALYRRELFANLSDTEELREKVRNMLIQEAEMLIKEHAGTEDSKKGMIFWNEEKRMIQKISAIAVNKPEFSHLVCTPRFARRFGLAQNILELIRNSRDFFSDTEQYLLTGAYYSSASEGLFLMHTVEYENTLAALPQAGPDNDEFTAYGIERAHFAYALYCLEKGDSRFAPYFENALALFEKSPEYEKQFINRALDTHDIDEMQRYETALGEILQKYPKQEIRKALAELMIRRAVRMHNKRKLTIKATEATIRKALKVDPENEYAKMAMENMQVEVEMEELFKAISKRKMNKACRIAGSSKHEEIRDEFFSFMNRNLEHLEDADDMSSHEKVLLLNDFFKWCARVDDSHPILYDIDEMIEELEED